jgi:hypothetical protein
MSLLWVFVVLSAIAAGACIAAAIKRAGRVAVYGFEADLALADRKRPPKIDDGTLRAAEAERLVDSLADLGAGDYVEDTRARSHVDGVIERLEELQSEPEDEGSRIPGSAGQDQPPPAAPA